MATYNPASGNWTFLNKSTGKEQLRFYSGFVALLLLTSFWQHQVNERVPDPYLDEVFHVPQAQLYCSGDYETWDDKITTPPGLYAFSNIILKLSGKCSTAALRKTNLVALFFLFIFAATCRTILESIPFNLTSKTPVKSWSFRIMPISSYAVHMAFNIALFPPIFFFSSLYYTDILSTALVILTYCVFLRRKAAYDNSTIGGVDILIYGISSLTMRQTNIFWVAVFTAGLELVRAVKSLGPFAPRTWKGDLHPYKYFQLQIEAYARGEIHDPNIKDAALYDYALCTISIATAAICNPVLVVTRLWPYLALLCSFAAFVVWNGGVVLGDKSNHTATIHLSQMLYIWPFFTFFSAPLLYPFALNILKSSYKFFISNEVKPSTQSSNPQGGRKYQTQKSSESQGYILTFLSLTTPLIVILTIIHYNTIIHPFTLADNRHYVFYVFRYSIRAHPLIKYLLGPIYLVCSYLVLNCLSGLKSTSTATITQNSSKTKTKKNMTDPTIIKDKSSSSPANSDSTTTSFVLIWFLTTSLSLITAPLVEPRYFIIPWVMWRLQVPATLKGKYNYRLWLETLWFLGINAVTGYVFLFRGFEWVQEPGKVQRFMW